jgi:hypothetical protein
MSLFSAALLLTSADTSDANGVCSIGECDKASYNYEIDCTSFTKPKGWTTNSTCALEGDWSAIIHRPLPDWYADMKFGIFIHWGIYSVPSYGTEWFWHNVECGNEKVKTFKDNNFGVNFSYPEFAPMFRAELFDADQWATTIKSSGAQYVLPVAKHHDGFCMWNASDTAPGNSKQMDQPTSDACLIALGI